MALVAALVGLLVNVLTYLAIALAVAFLIFLCCRATIIPGIWYDEQHQWPLVGNWPSLFANIPRLPDYKLDQALVAEAAGKEILQRVGPFNGMVELISPRMVQYMLKDNFDNFHKGPRFREIFNDLTGTGIFNADGDVWRRTRKAASHMFSASKLNNFMLVSFLKHARVLSEILDQHVEQRDLVDMQKTFLDFTMDAICEIGFGINLDSLHLAQPPPFAAAFDKVSEATMWRLLGPHWKFKIYRLFHFRTERTMAENVPIIDAFVYNIIRTRRENADCYESAGDLLSLFLAEQKAGKIGPEEQMDDRALRDLILNFMLAGRDTTAALLTWLFYELSERPSVYEEVLAEIESTLGALPEGGDVTEGITDETLKQLTFLEAVLYETLRLHPPVPNDSKRSIKPCTFPDGTRVPGDMIVAYSPYVMGRLKSIWGDDAQEFRPDRWLSEPDVEGERTLIQKSQYAFPQFNAGFRLCLGKNMALLEAKVVAVSVLRKHRLTMKPGHNTTYRMGIVMFMAHGLPMTVTRKE